MPSLTVTYVSRISVTDVSGSYLPFGKATDDYLKGALMGFLSLG